MTEPFVEGDGAVISRTERAELKTIVRSQFKVLRQEIEQRKAEVIADAEHQIADSYADEDERWSRAASLAHEAVLEANLKVNAAYRELIPEHAESLYVVGRLPARPARKRVMLRQEAAARIGAQVEGALLRLARQEADLIRDLAMGALESAEARQFLASIPAVSELVPVARLAELEASLGDVSEEDEGGRYGRL